MNKKKNVRNLSRRNALKGIAQAGFAASLTPAKAFGGTAYPKKNIITEENRKEGTTDWQLTYVRSKDHRSESLEGYCSRTSVRAGEQMDIFINSDKDTEVAIDVYRMGYYKGKGGRRITRLGPFSVSPQPTPPVAEHRLRQCQWKKTTAITIPVDWPGGVYLGKLSCSHHRYQSYIIFVVRDDRTADVMFQTSDTTWHAYNKWPDNYSLYDSDLPQQAHSARTRVSYNRPYGKYPQVVEQPLSQGSGEFLLWEYPLCFWLEKNGYDVTYCSNVDTHADAKGLQRVKCFLSVGHDEYWSLDMYNNVKGAIANGLSVGFLSGNSVKWVIDFQPATSVSNSESDPRTGLSNSGMRLRTLPDPHGDKFRTIYRLGRFGGLTDEEKAKMNYAGPFDTEGPNEGLLMGSRNPSVPNGSGDWIVREPDHWIFEGTGMKKGEAIRGIVGWEHHGDPADIPGLQVIASGPTLNSGGKHSESTATVYPGPKGNWVFNAATIFWCIGLSKPPGLIPPYSHFGRPHGEDERVQRITANFLKRCGIV